MTTIELSGLRALEPVTFDLYRDIHKGIRAELFALTSAAGTLDPADRIGRVDLASYVHSVADLLVTHAEHEDAAVQPVLEAKLPELAATVAAEHPALDAHIAEIRSIADRAVDAPSSAQRGAVHHVYLELAAFTSAYLSHQDFEEREVMPALERAVGVDHVVAIHHAIISAIPPADMSKSLALMLPALNIDDRAELLGGMRQGAPEAVFDAMWSLACSVLTPCDGDALAQRLGVTKR